MSAMLSLLALSTLIAIGYGSMQYVPEMEVMPTSSSPDGLMASDSAQSLGDEGSTITYQKVHTMRAVTKWKQFCGNLPVEGSILTTHADENNMINKVEGFIAQNIAVVISTNVFSSDQALAAVKKQWGHDSLGISGFTFKAATENVLFVPKKSDKTLKSGWKIQYFVHEASKKRFRKVEFEPMYITALVDGSTKEIEYTYNGIQTAKLKGVFGNNQIGLQEDYMEVRDEGRRCYHQHTGKRIQTIDMRNQEDYYSEINRINFRCSRAKSPYFDQFVNTAGYSPRNEAFLFANHFVDMWYEFVGHDVGPHQTNISWLTFFVHYGYRYENAFFQGEYFTFGDGASTFYPLTSLDIVCHEIGHAITNWHGGDMIYQGQSGGMNEAYSDILGETCDMYFAGKNNYLIGDDVWRGGGALRDMCDPKRLGSIDHFRDYNDGINVHLTSGIYNKAWCNLSKRPGWNYIMAFKVFTQANLNYWYSDITMHCGVCGAISSARDYGFPVMDVVVVFDGVGVYCMQQCPRRSDRPV